MKFCSSWYDVSTWRSFYRMRWNYYLFVFDDFVFGGVGKKIAVDFEVGVILEEHFHEFATAELRGGWCKKPTLDLFDVKVIRKFLIFHIIPIWHHLWGQLLIIHLLNILIWKYERLLIHFIADLFLSFCLVDFLKLRSYFGICEMVKGCSKIFHQWVIFCYEYLIS